jgi:hypothetical protein
MLLLAQGVPMHVVKDILGHSQISTTIRYAHPTEQIMRDATAEMAALLPEDQDDKRRKKRANNTLAVNLAVKTTKPVDHSAGFGFPMSAGDGTRTRTGLPPTVFKDNLGSGQKRASADLPFCDAELDH